MPIPAALPREAIIVVGLALLATVVVFSLLILHERRRAKGTVDAFAEVGRRLGWEYVKRLIDPLDALAGRPRFFDRGRDRAVGPALLGTSAGRNVIAGFLNYTVRGEHGDTRVWKQFVLFPDMAVGWPEFELGPEGPAGKLVAAFGGSDVDFDGTSTDETFSKRYRLSGSDEPGIRRLFSPEVREYLAERRGWTIQAAEGRVVLSRDWREARSFRLVSDAAPTTDEVERFINEATVIAGMLGAAGDGDPLRHPSASKPA